jgi:hypothetical protein
VIAVLTQINKVRLQTCNVIDPILKVSDQTVFGLVAKLPIQQSPHVVKVNAEATFAMDGLEESLHLVSQTFGNFSLVHRLSSGCELAVKDLGDVLAAVTVVNVGGHTGAVLAKEVGVVVLGSRTPRNETIVGEEETCLFWVFGVVVQHLRSKVT